MPDFDLGGGYVARAISYDTYRAACQQLESQIFGANWNYDFGPSAKSPPPLGETFVWGIYSGAALIGWSCAYQSDQRTVYMADTGLLPAYQGQGIYKKLLPHLLETFSTAGYTLVQSHHRATNNRVIIPKLRAGFFVQGFHLYEGGLNVALTCSLADHYRAAQHVRSGLQQAGGEAAQRLGVQRLGVQARPVKNSEPLSVPLPSTGGRPTDLGGGYLLWRVPYEIYQAVYAQLEAAAYQTVSLDWDAPEQVTAPEFRHYTWLVSHGLTSQQQMVVGWQHSRQWNSRTAYMVNTAFLPAHRSGGLYTRLLPQIMTALYAEGYSLIRSHHHATNNAVIIPKLRAGFRLQGLETDEHGVMAVLIHSATELYNRYMDVRSGLLRPSGEVARRLGLE